MERKRNLRKVLYRVVWAISFIFNMVDCTLHTHFPPDRIASKNSLPHRLTVEVYALLIPMLLIHNWFQLKIRWIVQFNQLWLWNLRTASSESKNLILINRICFVLFHSYYIFNVILFTVYKINNLSIYISNKIETSDLTSVSHTFPRILITDLLD